ncbi:MAG TPA: dimethylarginine dimethylaminohydrolase family protein [Bacillaceae bacterium]
MTLLSNKEALTFCASEYDTLHKVILCEPRHMAIEEVINETQKHYQDDNIDRKLAMMEHRQFTEALREHGVEVEILEASPDFPEQVFTRDIGFTVGETLFVAEMASDIRQGEEKLLKKQLKKRKIPYKDLKMGSIEGGDVIVDRTNVYVGISSRTNEDAISELEQSLPDSYRVHRIPFHERYLHLDCVFNILSPEEALVFPQAIDREALKLLESRYDLIEVMEEEQFTLGTNVLSIGNRKVFSLPVNKKVNRQLRSRGYTVIQIDLSEIIKSGGSFRCCTLPVMRNPIGSDAKTMRRQS